MSEQEEFFTKMHERLLAVAVWSKYLAWLALFIAVLLPIALFIEKYNEFYYFSRFDSRVAFDFIDTLTENPVYTVSLVIDLLSAALRGIVSFLVLKGISLGLYMIIETDLNYRLKNEPEVVGE